MSLRRPTPHAVEPGQESVWTYPRPPALESTKRIVRVELDGIVIADCHRALRILETSHPPTYYVHPSDVNFDLLEPSPRRTWCEWKGEARYFNVRTASTLVERPAWRYASPTGEFAALAGYFAFYPALLECFVDDAAVTPQPGEFYGGWVTPDLAGPFKGQPGTAWW